MTGSAKAQPCIDIPTPPDHQYTDQQMAEIINKHFVAVASDLPSLVTSDLPAFLPTPHPCPIVQPWDVYKELSKTKINKSGGPDGIPPQIIKNFALELSTPLADILNTSYKEGMMPRQWKRAVVVPVPKSNPPILQKLQPISLTDKFAKLAELLVSKWVLSDIEPHINEQQFGNRKAMSTTHCLVDMMNLLYKHSEAPEQFHFKNCSY